jgi:Xaa-Pro dipeptidase
VTGQRERARHDQLRKWMAANQTDVVLLVEPANLEYMTGYTTATYSRPLVSVIRSATDRSTLIVPSLENDNARRCEAADEVIAYWETPEFADEPQNYLQALDRVLADLPSGATVGVEADHCSWRMSDAIRAAGHRLVDAGAEVARLRAIKSAEELELMRNAAHLVEVAVRESLAAVAVGVSETEIDAAGSKALGALAAADHPDVTIGGWTNVVSGPVRATAPHSWSTPRRLEPGDAVVHSRQVSYAGYRAELERTCFVGEPDEQQAHYFGLMLEARRRALAGIRAGVEAGAVDLASRSAFQEAGVGEHAWARIGHGIGLSTHEEPYLRYDNKLKLEAGMTVTVEPALGMEGIGAFRHSDTVIVTDDGYEMLTELPEDLQSMTL